MATTVTPSTAVDDVIYASFPIDKFETTPDGDLVVYGKATDGSVDADDQIVDPGWSAEALTEWMDTGPNVRVMHNPKLYPAGTGLKVELDRDGDGGHWVKALVSEPTAQILVRKKALRAFSIGIAKPVVARDSTGKARGGVIKGGEIFELSLVDRPANRNCGITIAKSVGPTVADDVWTVGDLDALLRSVDDGAAGDDAAVKAAPAGAQDGDEPDDGGGALRGEYVAAKQAWLAAEPGLGGAALTGTAFLAKRAAWQAWSGDADSYATFEAWSAKRATDPDVGGEDDPAAVTKDVTGATAADPALPGEEDPADAGAVTPPAEKSGAKDCPDCGATYHSDSKLRRCADCGAKLPAADKARKPEPDPAAEGDPDGQAEDDSDEATDDGDEKPARKGADVPGYAVARMHDVLCSAYSWAAVAAEYPTVKAVPDAVDVDWLRGQVGKATELGDMAATATAAAVAYAAGQIGKLDAAAVADARAELVKAHTDGDRCPTPDLSTIVKALPLAAHTVDAGNFARGPLTAGHQDPPPASMPNLDLGSMGRGQGRTFYTRAARAAARNALAAVHDHIAETFPDLCPMAPTKPLAPAGKADTTPVPVPAVPELVEPQVGLLVAPTVDAVDVAVVVKAAVTEAMQPLKDGYEAQLTQLRDEINKLSAAPDPAQAPLRGVVVKAAGMPDPAPVPAERRSLLAEAQHRAAAEQDEFVAWLHKRAKSPDPTVRETAEGMLTRILGG